MTRTQRVGNRISDRALRAACAISLVVTWTGAATAAYGQWTGTNPVVTNSNVGIGTTNPSARLHISGSGVTPLAVSSDNYYYVGIGGNQNNSQIGLALSMKDGVGNYRTGYLIGYGGGQTTLSLAPPTGGDVILGDLNAGGGVNPSLVVRPNANVGIGTTTPAARLHIVGDVQIDQVGAESKLYLGATKATSAGRIYWDNNNLRLSLGVNDVNHMTLTSAGNVGIGITSPVHKLQVAGTIGAQEVVVSSTGADYVFDPSYRLRPLSEVSAYIKANRHLPDVPAASETQAKGIGVGDMQTKLLAKIEELTLHMIHEHERNDRLERMNEQLRDEVAKLSRRLSAVSNGAVNSAEKGRSVR